ncbi:MAG: hypothetical protein IIC55_09115, partial [Proteobacteria bacterium]|nr:hypothetical protein [Pseudomonadota bacterium]
AVARLRLGWLRLGLEHPGAVNLDNMRWHLAVTGLAAILIGVGLSRTRLGHSQG